MPKNFFVHFSLIFFLLLSSSLTAAPADFVLLVLMDGLRGDAFERGDTPNLRLLRDTGMWSTKAKSIEVTLTLPAHATLLTGQGLEKTGVRWNYHAAGRGRRCHCPNIFTLLSQQSYRSAAFYNKKKLQLLMEPAGMEQMKYCGWNPKKATKEAVQYLKNGHPHFLFVHLAEPDSSGHRDGWMSEGYFAGLRRADSCLGKLLLTLYETKATARTLIIVASDHGGRGKKHGKNTDEERIVPLLLGGNMVRRGKLEDGIGIECIVPTILWALGAEIPKNLDGRPLLEAFKTQTQSVD